MEFQPPPGDIPIEELREVILRGLIRGLPRDQIEDQLLAMGYDVAFVVGLVDSVKRTGSHDGVISGTATYAEGTLLHFNEDAFSKRKRRKAERGQRLLRDIAHEEGLPSPEHNSELDFGEPEVESEADSLTRNSGAIRWVFRVTVVVLLLVIVYWIQRQK